MSEPFCHMGLVRGSDAQDSEWALIRQLLMGPWECQRPHGGRRKAHVMLGRLP